MLVHKATYLGDDGKLHVPPTCAGYRLSVTTIEAAVMAALRELVSDDASLRHAMARAQLHIDDQSDAPCSPMRNAARSPVRSDAYGATTTQSGRNTSPRSARARRPAAGTSSNSRSCTIEDEIHGLENTLAVDQRLRERPSRSPPHRSCSSCSPMTRRSRRPSATSPRDREATRQPRRHRRPRRRDRHRRSRTARPLRPRGHVGAVGRVPADGQRDRRDVPQPFTFGSKRERLVVVFRHTATLLHGGDAHSRANGCAMTCFSTSSGGSPLTTRRAGF